MAKSLHERHAHGTNSFPFEIFNQRASANTDICYVHWHEEVEWTYVAEGVVEVFVDEGMYQYRRGQMFAIAPNALHRVRCIEDCRIIACVFNRHMLAFSLTDYVSRKYINPFVEGKTKIANPVEDPDGFIAGGFAAALRACREQPVGYQLDVKVNLLRIFEGAIRRGALVDAGEKETSLSVLEDVILYIQEHYSEKLTSEELARIAGYQPQYFSRLFKKTVGVTPIEYINRYRVKRACYALLDSNDSILDISIQCGFQSCSYFIKKFKEISGVSPKRYRREIVDGSAVARNYYLEYDLTSE